MSWGNFGCRDAAAGEVLPSRRVLVLCKCQQGKEALCTVHGREEVAGEEGKICHFLITEDVRRQAAGPSSAARVPGGPGNPGCCPFKTWGEKDANEEPAEN